MLFNGQIGLLNLKNDFFRSFLILFYNHTYDPFLPLAGQWGHS